MTKEQLSGKENREQNLTLLEKVRESLLTDERVYFAGEILHSPYGAGWLEAVDIIVAPVNPIYDAEKLNEFMHSLAPDIPRSTWDEARHYSMDSAFRLGKLYFDETVGSTTREIDITTTAVDPEALKRTGVHIGKSHETKEEELKRRTWVRIYPDTTSAKLIAEYEKGIKERTTEPIPLFEHMRFRLTSEQLDEIRNSEAKQLFRQLKLPRTNRV